MSLYVLSHGTPGPEMMPLVLAGAGMSSKSTPSPEIVELIG